MKNAVFVDLKIRPKSRKFEFSCGHREKKWVVFEWLEAPPLGIGKILYGGDTGHAARVAAPPPGGALGGKREMSSHLAI